MPNQHYEYLRLLAFLYLKHNKFDKAIAVLDGLRALTPEDRWVGETLAYALLSNEQPAACLELLDGLAIGKGNRRMQVVRMRALWATGKRDEASEISRN